jgi:hypothetical protein
VKDLSRIARNLKDTIIIDNSPASYLMHPECALPITSWYDDMDDTELYMLTPILQSLAKVDDVRDFIKSIVFEDKVLFNKASQVLQGGKMGERSQSQKPNYRGKQLSDDYMMGVNLSQQSGDINEEKDESVSYPKNNDSNEPVLSYFKSFQAVDNRKSRTGDNLNAQKRGGSQRRNQHGDPNQIHYMPKVENSHKQSPIDTVKNGWINKLSQEPSLKTPEQIPKVNENESSREITQRSTLKMKSKQILFKRNDQKTSSLVRAYKQKYKPEASPVTRYGLMTNRNSGEFRAVRRKKDLMLFTTNKNSRSTSRLENNFKSKNVTAHETPSRRKLINLSLA